jgi:arsenical pump membrane protein
VTTSLSHVATWSIAAAAVTGVITRPRNWSEAWWAVLGAAALVLFSLLPATDALAAIGKGTDVYLFLIGMMILAELARREGLFDWLAAYALQHARGDGKRLFTLIYVVGTLVTIFLSNDATAVVLTPAVYAIAKRAKVKALPYVLICALIANAASFVLPISNPANLVVFGDHMPRLLTWLREFGPPSLVAIIATYALLRWNQRVSIPDRVESGGSPQPLSLGGLVAAGAIVLTGVVLLIASTLGRQLGLPTCIAGLTAWLAISLLQRSSPWPVLKDISWSVLPLVAGLFVLVEAVQRTGALAALTQIAARYAGQAPTEAGLVGGAVVGFGANLINNLPMGLLASSVVQNAHLPAQVAGALLIGVDLGPNLSITGSLATILWLVAIRREGADVSAGQFLLVGCVVMPASLLATLVTFTFLH